MTGDSSVASSSSSSSSSPSALTAQQRLLQRLAIALNAEVQFPVAPKPNFSEKWKKTLHPKVPLREEMGGFQSQTVKPGDILGDLLVGKSTHSANVKALSENPQLIYETNGNRRILCVMSLGYLDYSNLDADHVTPIARVRERQKALLSYLNGLVPPEDRTFFLDQTGMRDFFGVGQKLEPEKDKKGNVILAKDGEPVMSSSPVLDAQGKSVMEIQATEFFYRAAYNTAENIFLMSHALNIKEGGKEELADEEEAEKYFKEWFEGKDLFGVPFVQDAEERGGFTRGVVFDQVGGQPIGQIPLGDKGKKAKIYEGGIGIGAYAREWLNLNRAGVEGLLLQVVKTEDAFRAILKEACKATGDAFKAKLEPMAISAGFISGIVTVAMNTGGIEPPTHNSRLARDQFIKHDFPENAFFAVSILFNQLSNEARDRRQHLLHLAERDLGKDSAAYKTAKEQIEGSLREVVEFGQSKTAYAVALGVEKGDEVFDFYTDLFAVLREFGFQNFSFKKDTADEKFGELKGDHDFSTVREQRNVAIKDSQAAKAEISTLQAEKLGLHSQLEEKDKLIQRLLSSRKVTVANLKSSEEEEKKVESRLIEDAHSVAEIVEAFGAMQAEATKMKRPKRRHSAGDISDPDKQPQKIPLIRRESSPATRAATTSTLPGIFDGPVNVHKKDLETSSGPIPVETVPTSDAAHDVALSSSSAYTPRYSMETEPTSQTFWKQPAPPVQQWPKDEEENRKGGDKHNSNSLKT